MHSLMIGALVLVTIACGKQPRERTESSLSNTAVSRPKIGEGTISFAIRGNLLALVDLPIVGRKPRLSTWWAIGQLRDSEAGQVMVETYCRINVGSAGPVHQVMEDKLVRAIPPSIAPARASLEGERLSLARGWATTVSGARLNDEREDLPQDPSDPRLWDQDADGHPGATVHVRSPIGNGDVFIVQRVRNQYQSLVTNGTITRGVVEDSSDQAVLGATNNRLNINPPTAQHPDLRKSPVVLVQTQEPYDCERLLREKDQLFPRS